MVGPRQIVPLLEPIEEKAFAEEAVVPAARTPHLMSIQSPA